VLAGGVPESPPLAALREAHRTRRVSREAGLC
jgi:hypothetical protein